MRTVPIRISLRAIPRRLALPLALALALVVSACSDESSASADGPLTVATSTALNADILRSAYGDSVEVVSVVPDSASPHGWSPAPKDVATLNDADVVVVNDVDAAEGLAPAVEAAEEAGQPVCEFGAPTGHDAHFHTSPTATAKALVALSPCLAEAAAELGIENTNQFADWASVHASALSDLAAEVDETLAPIPDAERLLVSSHNSFSTFAQENSLQVLGSMLGSGGDSHGHGEANPAVITHLAGEINEEGLEVVFVSPDDPDDVADLLLSEVDHKVEVMTLLADSFDTDSTGVKDHMGLIRFNAAQILKGLHPEGIQSSEGTQANEGTQAAEGNEAP